jgi:hypothetical protein
MVLLFTGKSGIQEIIENFSQMPLEIDVGANLADFPTAVSLMGKRINNAPKN